MKLLLIYLVVILIMSAVTFFVYRADKHRAQEHEWRIRESVLLTLGLIGGAAGALMSMKIFRHKTKHRYFWAVNIISLIIHIFVVIFIIVYVL